MKQRFSLFIFLVLICLVAMPAVAAPAPTGATPEEIALYNMKGPAGQGMPAFAKGKLGTERGVVFVAAKEASAPVLQHGYGDIMDAAQALAEETGVSLVDAIRIILDYSGVSYYEAKDNMKMYDYGVSVYYTLATQENAVVYQNFTRINKYETEDIHKGTGYSYDFMGMSAEYDWHPDMRLFYTVELEDGTVLAQSNTITLPKPEE